MNCSATVARFIADGGRALRHARRLSRTSTASSPFVHGTGCGMAADGEGFDILQRTLWGYASHPNFAGVAHGRPRLRGDPDRRA